MQVKLLRLALGLVLAFAAINAFGGGAYGLAGAEGVPRAWLEGSPFSDYMVPSFVLLVVVGGAFLLASVAVFIRSRYAQVATFAAVTIVLVWLAVQVAIIGYVSWMQPATLLGALVILVLAWMLPRPAPRAA